MQGFNLDEYLALVESMVNVECGSRVKGGPAKIAGMMKDLYEKLGLSVTVHDGDNEYGPVLEIRNCPEDEKIDLLLSGHMDTVFPDGTAAERPYFRQGNEAYGPGVIDMKSGLVSMYYFVKAILEEKLDLKLCILLNSDEEISSVRSRDLISERARHAEYGMIFEPARKGGEYVSDRSGLARYEVAFEGVAAHAGVAPQDGASAIHEMAYFINEISKYSAYDIGTSVNVGIVSGGSSANVVCDLANCVIDTRFKEISESQKIEAKMEEMSQNPQNGRVKITVKRPGFRPPMNATEKTMELLSLLKEKGKEVGFEVKWVKTGGGSDGNFAAFEGCTVIDGMGPVGEGAHSAKEILRIDTVEQRLDVAVLVARELAERKGK